MIAANCAPHIIELKGDKRGTGGSDKANRLIVIGRGSGTETSRKAPHVKLNEVEAKEVLVRLGGDGATDELKRLDAGSSHIVSREHAKLECGARGWKVTDTSKFGTKRNGAKIARYKKGTEAKEDQCAGSRNEANP